MLAQVVVSCGAAPPSPSPPPLYWQRRPPPPPSPSPPPPLQYWHQWRHPPSSPGPPPPGPPPPPSPSPPPPPPPPPSPPPPYWPRRPDDGVGDYGGTAGVSAGAVAGGAIGGLVALSMLAAGLVYLCRQKSQVNDDNAHTAARAASSTTGQAQEMTNVHPQVAAVAVVQSPIVQGAPQLGSCSSISTTAPAQPMQGSLYPPAQPMQGSLYPPAQPMQGDLYPPAYSHVPQYYYMHCAMGTPVT